MKSQELLLKHKESQKSQDFYQLNEFCGVQL